MTLDVATFQVIASLSLTFASLAVAVLSLFHSYRHNRGWKPIILVVAQARLAAMDTPPYRILLAFEVWNRHKYPIIIDRATVAFNKLTFLDPPDADEAQPSWLRDDRVFECYLSESIDQSGKYTFHLSAPYDPPQPG